MGTTTKIEWTDATWNPTKGCSMAASSETGGCLNCYAARQALRHRRPGGAYEGLVRMTGSGPRWTGKVLLAEDALEAPLRWRKSRRVFVDSMSDLWHEKLFAEEQAEVYAVMAAAFWHTFQVLTKRPERRADAFDDRMFAREVEHRMLRYLNRDPPAVFRWPLGNVWEGVSCEDQKTADARIPLLLQTPAAVRFVSAEPLLGLMGLKTHLPRMMGLSEMLGSALNDGGYDGRTTGLDWVIVGGESGPGARPCDFPWVRDIIAQCKAAGVPCFVKQLGADPFDSGQPGRPHFSMKDRKGGDPYEWPADLRVREFPVMASGRL